MCVCAPPVCPPRSRFPSPPSRHRPSCSVFQIDTKKQKEEIGSPFFSCPSLDGCCRFLPDVIHIRHQREATAVSKGPERRDPRPSLSRGERARTRPAVPHSPCRSEIHGNAARCEPPRCQKAIVAMVTSISPILTVQFVSKHPLTKVTAMSRRCDCQVCRDSDDGAGALFL